MTRTNRGREARVEIRMTDAEKALLERAAALGGEDLSAYMRRVSLTDARRLLPSEPVV